jgi:hypothetical protein
MLENFVNRPLKLWGRILKVAKDKVSSIAPFARVMFDQDGTPVTTTGEPRARFDDDVPASTSGFEYGFILFFIWAFFQMIP